MARILVVDDEQNIRMMVRLALESSGHDVVTAADGADGLAAFGAGRDWDLVLVDQRMPGMDGLAVLRELRRRAPKVRTVMITAFGTVDLAVEAMRAGATDFLRKPFTAEALRGAVSAALTPAPSGDALRAADKGVTYAWHTLNGYRIETAENAGEFVGSEFRVTITAQSPAGERRACRVALPGYIVELVKAYAECDEVPSGNRFWVALAEECLANHLWQQGGFPPEGMLRVEELSTGLKRWIDVVIAAGMAHTG